MRLAEGALQVRDGAPLLQDAPGHWHAGPVSANCADMMTLITLQDHRNKSLSRIIPLYKASYLEFMSQLA